MKKIILTLAALGIVAMPAMSEELDTVNGIKKLCGDKWAQEYSMQEHCQLKELKAARKVLLAISSYSEEQFETLQEPKIIYYCIQKWTNNDSTIEWSMVDYCSDKEIAAYRRLHGGN
jgi:hypothetical protein